MCHDLTLLQLKKELQSPQTKIKHVLLAILTVMKIDISILKQITQETQKCY